MVDLCTGSGAIALAIAAAAAGRPGDRGGAGVRPRWPGPGATPGPGGRRRTPVELRGGDIFDERLLADLDGAVDLVTANPPYVPDGTAVEPEVADHDPPEAVFAGPDGLAVIRPLLSVAAGLLKVGGVLAIEHDDTQGESVPALLRSRRVLDRRRRPPRSGRPAAVRHRHPGRGSPAGGSGRRLIERALAGATG